MQFLFDDRLKGSGVRDSGSNFPFPIDLLRRAYNTLTLLCQWPHKNKALLTWRLADIHDVSQNTPPEI